MSKRLIFMFLVFFGLTAVSAGENTFSTLAKGYYASGIEEKVEAVFYDADAFSSFFKKNYIGVTPAPKIPEVDFKKDMVVAVSPGPRMSGGYDVEIVEIVEMEGKLVVEIRYSEPGPSAIVTTAITQPHHIVSTPKRDLPVVFRWEEKKSE
ncbi:MAG: protease complex subunit PrcB family protein [Deltaproteobacteria bacterium]|uniref:Protease complex subunit PrcB family protein n=1 Tax=Candidatus Zymogenus saltonus TaxID=2844893 RepID=A0A9D8PNJ9_9DELT|nr:protease complex subunit PrcB family protein [Candidatus Zymogenus saltonus]